MIQYLVWTSSRRMSFRANFSTQKKSGRSMSKYFFTNFWNFFENSAFKALFS